MADVRIQATTTQTQQPPQPAPEHPQAAYNKKKVIFRTYQIVWYVLGVIEALLAFRIVLKLLAANQGSSFVNLIYSVSDPLAAPFSGIFRVTYAEGSVLEWSTIVGMIVYAILAYGIVKMMQIAKPTTPEEVDRNVDV